MLSLKKPNHVMNQEQVLGLIRHALTTIGGIVIAKGWIDETTAVELTGGLMSVIGFVWSFWTKIKPKQA